MNKIVLFKTSVAWYAKLEGPHAAQVRDLFGTDTIPTAYTGEADAKTVQAHVAFMNPGVEVSVETHPRMGGSRA